MRIKCPNSEVLLELPGNRSDMKFTCPACHKVHRVTVSITTPGEEPASTAASARAAVRPQVQIPKKYATGAYAPVVDVPIDANFVLLDPASVAQAGVDLGQAAEPAPAPRPAPAPSMDRDLSSRQTEIVGDRRPQAEVRAEQPAEPPAQTPPAAKTDDPPSIVSAAGEETRDLGRAEEPAGPGETHAQPAPGRQSEGRRMWDEVSPAATPASARTAPESAADSHSRRSASIRSGRTAPRKRGIGRAVATVLVAGLLAAAGVLGWQQYLYESNAKNVKSLLDWADQAWKKGDIHAAANAARQADAALRQGSDIVTAGSLWNQVALRTGLFAQRPSPTAAATAAIQGHLEREKELASLQGRVDPSDRAALVDLLASVREGKDKPLAGAMEKSIAEAVTGHLRLVFQISIPEEAIEQAEAERRALAPSFDAPRRADFNRDIDSLVAEQRERLITDVREEVDGIALDAAAGNPSALTRYRALAKRLDGRSEPELAKPVSELAQEPDSKSIRQLARLSGLVDKAYSYARSVLGRANPEEKTLEDLAKQAESDTLPNPAMAEAAAKMISDATSQADDLFNLRTDLFGKVQAEMRRGRTNSCTRLAWSMLRIGFEDPSVEIDPASCKSDGGRARIAFTVRGMPVRMELTEADAEKTIRAGIGGYNFTSGWAVLFRKPVFWMAALAEEMRKAGVDPKRYPDWEVMEGPGGPLALSRPAAGSPDAVASLGAEPAERQVFFAGKLRPVTELPLAGDVRRVVADFRQAAEKLHNGVMGDESIPQPLRQALKPVLMGTYMKPDPRDYFDSAFARRLVEANYLATNISPMPADRQRELDAYRAALGKLEAGYDDFSFVLDNGDRMIAVTSLESDADGRGRSSDQDPETGEGLSPYTWREEKADATVFFSPLPSRFVYSFMLADYYPGKHKTRPVGQPELTEVWHTTKGRVASYLPGSDKAKGDADLWNQAVAEDSCGRTDASVGPPGWNFPLHVLVRDDQGDPVTLATLSGVVKSPDFTGIADEAERRRAEDAWLDSTARTLATPGELGLIFHQFFRYCSDSPLPEKPNLIGSHFGLSDTHQTVYESLERRWAGRLVGDCDDLAEFFQVLTRRQGKLSHVMQLPGHAACGYVEKRPDGSRRFVVLQTGPVLQFNAPTLNEVVETAYRAFDRGEGISHMTTDAVPLLLRFANEETRTPFVLSARIYEDADYADTMIKVQSFWHEHVYSAAIKVMEDMVRDDKEIGNIKELGSLYERVGMYDKSADLRRQELELVKDQPQAAISTLLEIAQLHVQDKDKKKALAALGEMEARMQDMIKRDDAPEFFRAMTFRSFWAMYLSRLGQPARAWNLVRYDASMTKRQLGRIADPVLRTMVFMYERMSMAREAAGGTLSGPDAKAMDEVRRELEEAFGRGCFKADDSYNAIIGRYFVLGRYAVSNLGRKRGIDRLLQDGPYPEKSKDQTKRGRGVDDEDWNWFRITPQLYLAMGVEMLDRDEFPEFYDPKGAKPLLEDVVRAVAKGTGLGSDVAGGDDVIKAEMTLSFLNRDLAAFRRCMTVVKEKNYSSLYDDAAMTFGLHCGLIPVADFPAWVEAFRDFFPGSQHYFKVVYRAIDKENYDHALVMAEATAKFFPDNPLLRQEADFVRGIIPGLKARKAEREQREADKAVAIPVPPAQEAKPAA